MSPGQIQPSSSADVKNTAQSIVDKTSEAAGQAGEIVRNAAGEIAGKVNAQVARARTYLQESDLPSSMSEVKVLASRHPVATAVFGIGVGVILGKLLMPKR